MVAFLTNDVAAPPETDLVRRDLTASAINCQWCGDLTEVLTNLYLATVEELASKRVVGFGLSERHDAEHATGALTMAVAVCGGDVAGTICSGTACSTLRIDQSMGRGRVVFRQRRGGIVVLDTGMGSCSAAPTSPPSRLPSGGRPDGGLVQADPPSQLL
jgi:hypothetical protein